MGGIGAGLVNRMGRAYNWVVVEDGRWTVADDVEGGDDAGLAVWDRGSFPRCLNCGKTAAVWVLVVRASGELS